ncbi:hypothetical protein U0070_019774 [Myodes glareolus]|uniref:Uncharacterized protein n=1 Tax=Myodes glareolus TaxID=447135 RepID=A0AAW0JB36_MYOGA
MTQGLRSDFKRREETYPREKIHQLLRIYPSEVPPTIVSPVYVHSSCQTCAQANPQGLSTYVNLYTSFTDTNRRRLAGPFSVHTLTVVSLPPHQWTLNLSRSPQGTEVLLKELTPRSLKPRWTGPHTDVQSLMDLMQPLTPQLLQKPLVVSASAAGHRNRFLEEIKEKRKVASLRSPRQQARLQHWFVRREPIPDEPFTALLSLLVSLKMQ